MSKLRLTGDTSGYIEIQAPDAAGSNTLVLPTSNGSANQFLRNGSTAGTLQYSSMVEDSASNVGIGTASIEANTNYSTLEITGKSGSGGGILRLKTTDRTTAKTMLFCDTGGFEARVETNHPFVISTNNAERLRVLAGGGLTFNGDTAAANALDDYEEGDWTPRIRDSNGNAATVNSANAGSYTKIGDRVFITGRVQTSSVVGVTGSSTAFITGLPFAIQSSNKGRGGISIGYANNLATGGAYAVAGYGENADTRISLTKFDVTSGVSALTVNQWSDDGDILFSFSYQAN